MKRRSFLKNLGAGTLAAIASYPLATQLVKLEEIESEGVVFDQMTEWELCRNNPMYFISKYVKFPSPLHDNVYKSLYFYQMDWIDAIQNNKKVAILAGRQTGKTVIGLGNNLHRAMFFEQSNIKHISVNSSMTQYNFDKLREMYSNLPDWMKAINPIVEHYRTRLVFKNRSKIDNFIKSPDTIDVLDYDESEFEDTQHQERTFYEIMPRMNSNSKMVVHSTPGNRRNLLHKIWHNHPNYQDWVKIKTPSPVPDRLIGQLSKTQIDQEFNCHFV